MSAPVGVGIARRPLALSLLLAVAIVAGGCAPPPVDELADRRDVRGLVGVMTDATREVEDRVGAARALGDLGEEAAVDALAARARDPAGEYDRVAAAAARALGAVGGTDAVAALRRGLEEEGRRIEEGSHRDIGVYRAVLAGLGEAGGAAEVPVLLEAAARPPSGEPGISEAAHRALVRIGRPAVPGLVDAADRGAGSRRLAAVRALADIGDPRARGVLTAALKVRLLGRDAALGLAGLDGNDLGRLLPLLKERSTLRVYYGLIALGRPRAEEPMLRALLRFGDPEMSLALLTSENDELEAAVAGSVDPPLLLVPPGGPVLWDSL